MSGKASRQASLQVYPPLPLTVTEWSNKTKHKTLKCRQKDFRGPKISSFKVGSYSTNRCLKSRFFHGTYNWLFRTTINIKNSTLDLQENIESPEESVDGLVSNSNDFSNSMSNRFDCQLIFGNSNSSKGSGAPLFSTFFKQFACRPPQLCVSTHAKTPIWLQGHFSS